MSDSVDLARVGDQPLDFLQHDDPAIRRLALSAMAEQMDREDCLGAAMSLLSTDPDDAVRAEAAEILGAAGETALPALLAALDDASELVVESAVTALGEIAAPSTVTRLMDIARGHDDKLVREAAVAALGSIADPQALPLLLETASEGSPQIRRRSIVALSVFEGDEVDAVLRAALDDRNPMVREAAEMVVRG